MLAGCSEDCEGVLVSCPGKIGCGAGASFGSTGAVGTDGVSRVDGRRGFGCSGTGAERGTDGNGGMFNCGNGGSDRGDRFNRGNEPGSTGRLATGGFIIGNPLVPLSEAPIKLVRSRLALVK